MTLTPTVIRTTPMTSKTDPDRIIFVMGTIPEP